MCCQICHALSYELVPLVVPDPLFGHLPPKLIGLSLQASLVVCRALLQASLQFGMCACLLLVHLLCKLHEFVLDHAAIVRGCLHRLASVLVGNCSMLV